ncbi:MAG: glycosyltransferase, partial [Gammaproteobacteria bacterium]|nr:glycosyltransferase [Gammaproteobacteria bacterium]
MTDPAKPLYICLISVHGLIRGHELELGRDADTGGQTKYVVELARALAEHPAVAQVDLLTRLIEDEVISSDYAQPIEAVQPGFRIVRIGAGPPGYIFKEQLWDHLDSFVDNAIQFLGQQQHPPDLLHSHYADAGYVGSRLALILDIPLVHTGHSLGRVKRQRLLASGLSASQIESRYHMARRIQAEELTLATAERVITSTHQEIEEQYELYDFYQPEQMRVIPPGTDLSQFHPPEGKEWQSAIAAEIGRFLREPERPMILALSRPDPRKNISALVRAYGEDKPLQEAANLVLVAGNREDIQELDEGAQEVLSELLLLIDHYDLYGKVAYPKHHKADEVPLIYRLATLSGGVFVNPALTEPFGLTLIEAAASGLPLVATEDGGPRDIIG